MKSNKRRLWNLIKMFLGILAFWTIYFFIQAWWLSRP